MVRPADHWKGLRVIGSTRAEIARWSGLEVRSGLHVGHQGCIPAVEFVRSFFIYVLVDQ